MVDRFRYDGIVDILNTQPGVVPVIAEKRESDKYRLQWKLVPGSASEFPESVLTLEEQVLLQPCSGKSAFSCNTASLFPEQRDNSYR